MALFEKNQSFLKKWGLPVLFLLVVVVFSPILIRLVFGYPRTDYNFHIRFAQQMYTGSEPVPLFIWAHSAWHFLVIFFSFLTAGSFPAAGFLATLFSIFLLAWVLYSLIKPVLLAQGISLWWGIFFAIGLNLVSNLYLYSFWDRFYYFGYLGLITYHNPTIILLRPLSILVFILALRCFQTPTESFKYAILAALFSLLATFTKPTFAICFLPALGLLVFWNLVRKHVLDWKLIILGFLLPTVTALALQYWLTYLSGDTNAIIFAPFTVFRSFSHSLAQKLILSILFPVLVSALYFKAALKDKRMQLAWLTLVLACIYAYLLAESGPRFADGNFTWSSEIASLVMFCMASVFFLERITEKRWKSILLGLVWLLHLGCGIGYYFHILLAGSYS